MLTNPSRIRAVKGITAEQRTAIWSYLQGMVYCWVKNRSGEWFAARDLVGGENYEWSGTPLIALYNKHTNQGKVGQEAVGAAAKDLGWLLKAVIHRDKRRFRHRHAGLVSQYRWLGNEP